MASKKRTQPRKQSEPKKQSAPKPLKAPKITKLNDQPGYGHSPSRIVRI